MMKFILEQKAMLKERSDVFDKDWKEGFCQSHYSWGYIKGKTSIITELMDYSSEMKKRLG